MPTTRIIKNQTRTTSFLMVTKTRIGFLHLNNRTQGLVTARYFSEKDTTSKNNGDLTKKGSKGKNQFFLEQRRSPRTDEQTDLGVIRLRVNMKTGFKNCFTSVSSEKKSLLAVKIKKCYLNFAEGIDKWMVNDRHKSRPIKLRLIKRKRFKRGQLRSPFTRQTAQAKLLCKALEGRIQAQKTQKLSKNPKKNLNEERLGELQKFSLSSRKFLAQKTPRDKEIITLFEELHSGIYSAILETLEENEVSINKNHPNASEAERKERICSAKIDTRKEAPELITIFSSRLFSRFEHEFSVVSESRNHFTLSAPKQREAKRQTHFLSLRAQKSLQKKPRTIFGGENIDSGASASSFDSLEINQGPFVLEADFSDLAIAPAKVKKVRTKKNITKKGTVEPSTLPLSKSAKTEKRLRQNQESVLAEKIKAQGLAFRQEKNSKDPIRVASKIRRAAQVEARQTKQGVIQQKKQLAVEKKQIKREQQKTQLVKKQLALKIRRDPAASAALHNLKNTKRRELDSQPAAKKKMRDRKRVAYNKKITSPAYLEAKALAADRKAQLLALRQEKNSKDPIRIASKIRRAAQVEARQTKQGVIQQKKQLAVEKKQIKKDQQKARLLKKQLALKIRRDPAASAALHNLKNTKRRELDSQPAAKKKMRDRKRVAYNKKITSPAYLEAKALAADRKAESTQTVAKRRAAQKEKISSEKRADTAKKEIAKALAKKKIKAAKKQRDEKIKKLAAKAVTEEKKVFAAAKKFEATLRKLSAKKKDKEVEEKGPRET